MKNFYKTQRLELQLANGLDSLIESKERQRQAKLARESKESKNSQQDKRHNTDITSSYTQSQTIESKQKDSKHNTKQIIDSLLTLKIINGGYKDKLWSCGEEDTQANLLHITNIESKDSKATQENKDKQILEVYFSYGEECERLQEDSRHSSDVNLHIITQGYNNGEEVEVLIKTNNDEFNLQGKINNNEAILYDIFKDKYITIGEVKVYV